MLQFLSPLALLALAAVTIPAILHLWRPPAKTVRVGTLRFFEGPAVRRLTKLQWRERLLLAIRLLLLVMLVLLLARPVWNKPPPTIPQRWALIDPDVVLEGDALRRWRELDSNGYETRKLAPGFPKISWTDKGGVQDAAAADVWSYLREADAQLPAGSEVAIFSSDRISSLRGARPILRRIKVEWISVSPNDPRGTWWIESAHLSEQAEDGQQKLRCFVGVGSATQTRRVPVEVPAAPGRHDLAAPLDHLALEVRAGEDHSLSVRVISRDGSSTEGQWLAVSAAKPLHVVIIRADERREDAHYVAAAVRALSETSGRRINVEVSAPDRETDVSRAAWIFWLSDEPVPPSLGRELKERDIDLLSDAEKSSDAAGPPVLNWILFDSATSGSEQIGLFRRTPASSEAGASIWTDASGQPLLTVQREGRGRHWRFASRFHPEWNDLPRSGALAAALRSLLSARESGPVAESQDVRRADPTQAAPAQAPAAEIDSDLVLKAAPERLDLHRLFWTAAVALFGLERVLSYRRSRVAAALPTRAVSAVPEHVTS